MMGRHRTIRRATAVLLALVYLAFFTVAALHKDPSGGNRQYSFYSFALPEPVAPCRDDARPSWMGNAENATCRVCLWHQFGKDMPTTGDTPPAGETDAIQRLLTRDISVRLVLNLSPHAPRAPPAA